MSNDKGHLHIALYNNKEQTFKVTENLLLQNRHEIGKFLLNF